MKRILPYGFFIVLVFAMHSCKEDENPFPEEITPMEETFDISQYWNNDYVNADCANRVTLDAGVDSASYLWNPSGETTRTIEIYETGLYAVQITTADSIWTDSLNVVANNGPVLYIPNMFSPNGDAVNDFFQIYGICAVDLKVQIFNKSSTQIIYESTDRQAGWDGTYKGESVEIGLYPYNVQVRFAGNDIASRKGTVLLLR